MNEPVNGLVLRPAAPSQQSQIDALQRQLYERNRQLNEAEARASAAEAKVAALERGVAVLRDILSPLYNGLKAVFGEIDALDIDDAAATPTGSVAVGPLDSRKSAVWESWKQKLSGIPARFIDALLLHGELTQTQLRIHAQCAKGSVPDAVSKMWKAGIINKNGGKISLKNIG